ncbi:MAG: hypothetical protein CMH53_02525 [Myxococcales bacterium]|nr:hypothetical protein [Myxococcales bacterium]
MTQSAAEVPVHTMQRKAALVNAAVLDHAGAVDVKPIENFDLGKTIFSTLQGALPRFVIRTRIAKHVNWQDQPADRIEGKYQQLSEAQPLPAVSEELLRFLVEQCDFDVEHADGSFLDHLYFCYEYTHLHYPSQSAVVMLLHSILGTGTNTFAMETEKMPALQALMTESEWIHVQAFPSVLRLLYDLPLRRELWNNIERLDRLKSVSMHRVIDNEPMELSAEQLWVQLNYQLIHLADFLPAANWQKHANDTAFIIFRDLFALLQTSGRLKACLGYAEASAQAGLTGEQTGLGGKIVSLIPVVLSEKMAAKSVRRFSSQIGHSMDYMIEWS